MVKCEFCGEKITYIQRKRAITDKDGKMLHIYCGNIVGIGIAFNDLIEKLVKYCDENNVCVKKAVDMMVESKAEMERMREEIEEAKDEIAKSQW